MLSELNPDKVCFIIVKAREFDAETAAPIGDSSDASDDKFVGILTDQSESAAKAEAEGLIAALNVDEQNELIALMLVGRGDFGAEEWTDALAEAQDRPQTSAAAYLLGIPTVGDFLEEGLSTFGFSCEDMERDHL